MTLAFIRMHARMHARVRARVRARVHARVHTWTITLVVGVLCAFAAPIASSQPGVPPAKPAGSVESHGDASLADESGRAVGSPRDAVEPEAVDPPRVIDEPLVPDGPLDIDVEVTADAPDVPDVPDELDPPVDRPGTAGPSSGEGLEPADPVLEPAEPALELVLDLEVPRRLLAFIDRGAVTDDEIDAWLDLPGQREVLARGVPRRHLAEGAAAVVRGDVDPLMQPPGMPGTVRMEPIDAWRQALEWIAAHQERIVGTAMLEATPYLRPDAAPPSMTIYFHLAGGWDARTTDAIYVNLTRLLDTEAPLVDGIEGLVTREVAGAVLDGGLVPFVDFGSADAALLTCLHQMVRHGAARFLERRAMRAVYPDGSFAAQRLRAFSETDRRIDDAMGGFDRLVAAAVAGGGARAESLLVDRMRDETVPALGDLVCRTVFGAFGPDSLAAGLHHGPTRLFRMYETVASGRDDLPELPIALEARLDSLAFGLERRWLVADDGRRQAFAAFDAGDYEAALTPLRRIQDAMPGNPVDTYNLACALSMTGAGDEAMWWLEEAVRLGFRDPQHVRTDPDLEPLRDREDFRALIERLESGAPGGSPRLDDPAG